MHWIGERRESAPKVLDNALEAETHAKDGQMSFQYGAERLREIEIPGFPRTRREDNQVGTVGIKFALGKTSPQGENLGSGLAQIIGQGMDKGVLMIDQQDFLIPANRGQGHAPFRGKTTRTADSVEKGSGFDVGFFLFRLRVGVVQQGGACPDLGHSVFQTNGPQRQAGIQVAVKPNQTHRAAVPGAWRFFVIFNKLHGPGLGGAGDGHGPRMSQKGVECVKLVSEIALHMIDGMDQVGVHFDLTPSNYADAARLTNARLVIAVHVRTHGQLGLVFL